MQKAEDFMAELFQARIAEEKRSLTNRAPYRKRFFAADCVWDSRIGTLEMIESELIVSIERSDSEAAVITEFKVPFYASGAQMHRRRYHLKVADDSWLIYKVELQCLACHGQSDESCLFCKGKHWLSQNE